MSEAPSLSVAVPLYNEEATLPELIRRLTAVLGRMEGGPHQIVFVDDGSSDGTPGILREAIANDPRLRAILLSRNFGHQAALTAALDHVSGDAVIVMDGDLQDDPEVIPEFVARYRDGYDVVYAIRRQRREPWWLRASYYVFYRLAARLSSVPLPVDAGDFSLLSRRVVEHLRRAPERQRYLRGLRAWVGFRQIGVPVERLERQFGQSKYGPRKLFRLALDGLFAFSVLPLRLAALLGSLAIAVSVVWGAYVLWARLALDRSPQGFTSLILTIIFLSGANLFFLGVIGEYIGRIYEESKGRPHYVVEARLQHPSLGGTPPSP